MKPERVKEKFNQLAQTLFNASKEIESLLPDLALEADKQTAQSIITDLRWATENCTVIGLHQIGNALNDAMAQGTSTNRNS
jgi:hypothetical protein